MAMCAMARVVSVARHAMYWAGLPCPGSPPYYTHILQGRRGSAMQFGGQRDIDLYITRGGGGRSNILPQPHTDPNLDARRFH